MPASISEYVPQFMADDESGRRARAAWAAWGVILACMAGVVAMTVLAPVLRARGSLLASQIFYQFFHVACHQIPERSFHVSGYAFAVCARCFGMYAGALLGVALYPFARSIVRTDAPARQWLMLAAVPTTVDFVLGFSGLWENTHWSRFSTGLLLGAAAAFYVIPGLVDLWLRRVWRLSEHGRAERLKEVDPNLRASCG
jgi:uncharacterized membrane protein